MRTIWKFVLNPVVKQEVEMPVGAEILSAKEQRDEICVWALVNEEAKDKEARVIEVFGTGHEIPADMGVERRFLGTASLRGGSFIFHVFERV